MRQARSAVVPFILAAAFLPSISVAQGVVKINTAKPNWKDKAGKCVLAPPSCSASFVHNELFCLSGGKTHGDLKRELLLENCIMAEKKFLKRVQDILAVDGPDKLRSAFFDRSMEAPTNAEVLAIAREIGYESVLFADSHLVLEERRKFGDPDPVTKMPKKGVRTVLSGRTRLFLKTVDEVVLVDGEAEGLDRNPFRLSQSGFARKQLLNILKEAEQQERGK
jgi:hypothetical protein